MDEHGTLRAPGADDGFTTQDPAELEERRRTFWAAYFGDRWASPGSGWPMWISEREVFTRLPMSEIAFENGTDETSPFLPETLVGDGASKLASPFAAILIAATLFGRNFAHIYDKPKEDDPKDTRDGDFWRRHRVFDNILSSTFMHLPEHLKLSGGLQDLRTLFLHMSLHTSVISLHKAAVIIAIKHRLGPTLITRSVSRCIIAANEICNMMKTISHHDLTKMNPWTGCALYIAGRVYCHDIRISGPTKLESSSNLEYILSAMNEIMKRNSFIRLFITQQESELRVARHAAVHQETGVIGEILSTSPSNTCYLLSNPRSTDTDTSVNSNEPSEFEGDTPLILPEKSSRPPLSGIFIEDDPNAKSCPSEQLADHGNEQRTDLNEEDTSCTSRQDQQLKTHIPKSVSGRPRTLPSNNSSISFSSRSTLHTEQNPTGFAREFIKTKETEFFQDTLTSTEQSFNHNDSSAVRNKRIQNQAPTEMPTQYLPSNYGTSQPNFYAPKAKRRTNYDTWSSQRQGFTL